MRGLDNNYRWHVFARFPCNASGVRVAIRKTERGAEKYARKFARKNRVPTSWVIVREGR